MQKRKNLKSIIISVVILISILILSFHYAKSQRSGYFYDLYYVYKKKNKIKNQFNNEASVEHDLENLHYGSAWGYLTSQQFKEMILDGVSKMSPPINKNEKIFELGVGVGAALKVIETHIVPDQIEMAGSDIAENSIIRVKNIFPEQSDNFFISDMTEKHVNIPDNYYDHVVSFGALGMYLIKSEMKKAVTEAVRITKPGGSLLFTGFIAPGGKTIGSIVSFTDPSFFEKNAEEWGIENIKIYKMKHQGDRYQVTFNKINSWYDRDHEKNKKERTI